MKMIIRTNAEPMSLTHQWSAAMSEKSENVVYSVLDSREFSYANRNSSWVLCWSGNMCWSKHTDSM